MKTLYPIISLFICLLAGCLSTDPQQKNDMSSPADSVYTYDYIQSIYITEHQRALNLLDTAETKGKISDMKANYMRFQIYNNRRMFHLAETYLNKTLQSDSMKTASPMLEIRIKRDVITAYMLSAEYQKAMKLATEIYEKAKQIGYKRIEGDILFQIGTIYREQGLQEKAEPYVRQAIQMFENSNDIRELASLTFIYGQQMTYYYGKKEIDRAIEVGKKREKLIGKMAELGGAPPGYLDEQYGFLFSKMAVFYFDKGQKEKAAEAFKRYRATKFAQTSHGKTEALNYLILAGRYDEAANCLMSEKEFVNNQDSVSTDFLWFLSRQADIATGLGNYRAALNYKDRISVITDSITTREKQNAALELATIYETHQKDTRIKKQEAMLDRQKIIQFATISMLLLAGLTIYLVVRHLHTVKRKNRFLAKQINNQLKCQEELHQAKIEVERLKQMPENVPQEIIHESTKQEDDENNVVKMSPEDKNLFDKLDRLIEEEKLYLDPDITRDRLLKEIHISKNTFAQLIQTYAGTNFSGYINNKRLDYSIHLLREYNYTIEAVATDAGFNNARSFYRIFRNRYGMTPSEYRDSLTR